MGRGLGFEQLGWRAGVRCVVNPMACLNPELSLNETTRMIGRRHFDRGKDLQLPVEFPYLTNIGQLAQWSSDIVATVKCIVEACGQFNSFAEPWADTATNTERLMTADLSGHTDFERELIGTRTAGGRRQEPRQGARPAFGPPPKLTGQQ